MMKTKKLKNNKVVLISGLLACLAMPAQAQTARFTEIQNGFTNNANDTLSSASLRSDTRWIFNLIGKTNFGVVPLSSGLCLMGTGSSFAYSTADICRSAQQLLTPVTGGDDLGLGGDDLGLGGDDLGLGGDQQGSEGDDPILESGSDSSPVPVPAAVWLFSSALIGLFGASHRRKA